MLGLQVDGPLGVVLGSSQGLCGRSWAALRAYVGGPGPLSGPLWAVLGRPGAFVGGPGPSWVRSWVLCWRSWAALGVYVGGLVVLGPMLAVLGRSCASTGGPGPLLGPLQAVLAILSTWVALGAYVGDLGPLLGLY